MCDCIKQVKEKASENFVKQIEENNSVHSWIDKGDFVNRALNLSGGPSMIGMPFELQYIRTKRNGQPESRVTTKTIMFYQIYCPFCGEKFEDAKKENG